jgi:hypothetical protein
MAINARFWHDSTRPRPAASTGFCGGFGWCIYGQRYAADGTALGSDFQIKRTPDLVFGGHSAMQPTSVVQRCRAELQINEAIKRVLPTTPGPTTKQIADRIGASDSHTVWVRHSHTMEPLRRERISSCPPA